MATGTMHPRSRIAHETGFTRQQESGAYTPTLPHELREEREEQIRRGIEHEEAEEAKVEGIDAHETDVGGSLDAQPLDQELDELIDGSKGSPPPAAAAGGESEVYAQSPESDDGGGGATAMEVEGYAATTRAPERFMSHESMQIAEIVHGVDDRVRVFNTTGYPWRTICKLEITAANGTTWGCSGALIGPRTVLTNDHCVFMHDQGGWAKQIRVVPGKNGSSEPFGAAVSTFYHSVKGWTQGGSSNYDYAVCVLPSNKKLGNTVGWMGLANLSFFSLLGLNINNSGYPGDKSYGTQWWNANNILLVTSRRIYYQIDTFGGQSGSPDWRFRDGKRHIVGIHNTGGSPFNGGVRIVEPVFNNLVNWKNAYP
jgi:V8-like Glu-specific endopeptidase